jgi:hypothetical protein
VHSKLSFVSCRGEEYTSGPYKEWDVDLESSDLDLSLVALNIVETRNVSSIPWATAKYASFSIFVDEDEEKMDMY